MKEIRPWDNEQYQKGMAEYRSLMAIKVSLEVQLRGVNERATALRSSLMEQVTHSPIDYVPSERVHISPIRRLTERFINERTPSKGGD